MSMLMLTHHRSAQAASWSRACCILYVALVACSSSHQRTRSSAHSAAFTSLGSSATRSFIKTKKRVGDRTPPCGTPWRKSTFLLCRLSRVTLACRLNRYDLIQFNMLLVTPYLWSLTIKPSFQTLSKAFWRSIHPARTSFRSRKASSNSL